MHGRPVCACISKAPALIFSCTQNLKDQILTTNVWLEHEWQDHKFKWDPSEYGGVTELYVPSEHIWLPDIVLYNKWVHPHQRKAKVKIWTTVCIQLPQRWRWVRGDHHDEGHSALHGQGGVDPAGHFQIILRDWCALLSLRSADVLHEVRLLDLRRRSGMSTHPYHLIPSVCVCVCVSNGAWHCGFMGIHLYERWARAYKPKMPGEHRKGVGCAAD